MDHEKKPVFNKLIKLFVVLQVRPTIRQTNWMVKKILNLRSTTLAFLPPLHQLDL